jgi:ferric-dicitrate binding protein FerR (iron transport regulator)
MKEKMNTEKFTDREWEELASDLSGEKGNRSDMAGRFEAEDELKTGKLWNMTGNMDDNREIDVDNAWNRVSSRIAESGDPVQKVPSRMIMLRPQLLRIAAAALVLISLGIASVYLGTRNKMVVVATSDIQKNIEVTLPDGSTVILNRNTELSYRANFGKSDRTAALSGEAFFEIAPDPENPFTVDAGKASIKVVGTSFNIITNNPDSAVEVYVETGKVMLSDNASARSIMLDPGYIGTMDTEISGRAVNENPNYMSWKTGVLVYNGQTLDVVFRDLKRVYDMDIVADDPEISQLPWVSPPIDNQNQETIILLICRSFTLSYTKDGNVYHLSKK